MLIYKNINGEDEAVAARMVVRFSRRDDLTSNNTKPITYIHLANSEQLKSLDEIEILLKRLATEIKKEERNTNGRAKVRVRKAANRKAGI